MSDKLKSGPVGRNEELPTERRAALGLTVDPDCESCGGNGLAISAKIAGESVGLVCGCVRGVCGGLISRGWGN